MHGYDLKQNLKLLTGHFRPVSDGALYPAIARLERQGWIVKKQEAGLAAAPRQILTLTEAGEFELYNRLRSPSDHEISDRNRFFTILSFLSYLQPEEQRAVLERRLNFLQGGKSFFQKDGEPVTLAKTNDVFRKGMLRIARETSRVERQWLEETINLLNTEPGITK